MNKEKKTATTLEKSKLKYKNDKIRKKKEKSSKKFRALDGRRKAKKSEKYKKKPKGGKQKVLKINERKNNSKQEKRNLSLNNSTEASSNFVPPAINNTRMDIDYFQESHTQSNHQFKKVDARATTKEDVTQFSSYKDPTTNYGHKAFSDLNPTRGKDFRHEKNKKKRGSYHGGSIDTGIHSIKFNDVD